MSKMDLETAMKAIMAAKRADTDSLPSPDELLSFRAGRLAPEEREGLLERAASSPEIARALIDASRFPEVEPTDERDRVAEEDVARQWQRFQQRLRREALRQTPEAAPKAELPRSILSRGPWLSSIFGSLRFAQAAAAALLLVSLGLSSALIRQASFVDDGRPRLNLPIVELTPESESGERTEAERVEVPAVADGVFLVLTLGDRRSHPAYELEIRDPAGAVVWSTTDLQRAPEGFFTLELPRAFLFTASTAEGWIVDRYRIELWGIDGDRREALAVYRLTIVETSAGHEP